LAENLYPYICLSVSIFVYRNLEGNILLLITTIYIRALKQVKFNWTQNKLCFLTINRSPRGNFTNFLNRLDMISLKIYNKNYCIIICGDVNIHCVIDNNSKSQMDAVLHSYILPCIVKFPTKFDPKSLTAIENVFIDTSTIAKYDIYRLIHGMSDHDALLLTINNVQE